MAATATITRVVLQLVDLVPMAVRTDAIQSFEKQETPILTIHTADGLVGTGYTYTIGTGGRAVCELLVNHLIPLLMGKDASMIERIWHDLLFKTHATAVGAITSLALAAVDTALWDLRCKRLNEPLWKAAGGFRDRIELYTTEGGWLHLTAEELVANATAAKADGYAGIKVKIGKPSIGEDMARLRAIREAAGDDFEIFTDANQAFSVERAIRYARRMEALDIGWLEEPLPADDLTGHIRLCASTSLPIAVGESIYSIRHFREYLQQSACSIVQVDVARVGGITPWLKVAHLSEGFNIKVAPHFLMELHLSLCCAVPNAMILEYIPQLDKLTHSGVTITDGHALAPSSVGLGIDWDTDAIRGLALKTWTCGGDGDGAPAVVLAEY